MTSTADYQVMPPLSAEEYAALRADIAERGILVPVVRDQHGNLLDGHHRVQIAAELGVDYPHEVRQVDGHEQARDVAYALNLVRRHLSREQRRELIAKEIKDRPDDSDRAIGRRLGCDHKTVGSVRRELSGEIPHPTLTPAQRQHVHLLVEVMKQRTITACTLIRKDDHPLFWYLTKAEDCEDMAVLAEANRRFNEWADTAEEMRGALDDEPGETP